MSAFKIAWRGIQHRGLGSLLTVLSMALGVMTVVAVLTIHGVVSQSFKNNSSFGYDVIIGSRGGSMQLTLNTVYYLSRPLEPVPFEYFLAFRDQASREPYLRNSIAYRAHEAQQATQRMSDALLAGWGVDAGQAWLQETCRSGQDGVAIDLLGLNKPGEFSAWAEMVIPLTLGDYFSRDLEGEAAKFRVVGTTGEFFSQLVLDADTGRKFQFAQGRALRDNDPEHGFYECVVGAQVAREAAVHLGEKINPIHGEPGTTGAHVHEESGFTVVGILERTGTPHDRAVFINIEGFYLMDDHAKPIEEGRDPSSAVDDASSEAAGVPTTYDPHEEALPLEQREVTALLIRSNREDDPTGIVGDVLINQINNGGFLEPVLNASQFRPILAQVAPQACNPISEITSLFLNFVDPVRWVLLGLTVLLCVVSGISILVGIYNSMSQRRHEIAVLRALGARRGKVTRIMLAESLLLSLGGGLIGWLAGHGLNAAASPLVEAKAGVPIRFFDFAPPVPLGEFFSLGRSNFLPEFLQYLTISPEFLLIPGMVVLAVLVGVYPAISAYRTDVAKSLHG
jgi:putative ABC transport system permease protein